MFSFIKYEYTPKKVQPQLLNKNVFDIEIFSTYRVIFYSNCMYKLSKFSGNYNRDITGGEYEKCRNDCIVFKGTNCINETLDHVLEFKGQTKKLITNLLKMINT